MNTDTAANKKIRVACVGDSITQGDGENCYPEFLKKLLGEKYEVINFGEGGTTAQKNGYMRQPEIDGYNYAYVNHPNYAASLSSDPDVVIIMFGTNDAKMQNWFYDYDYKNPEAPCNKPKTENFYSDYSELIKKYISLPSAPKVIMATSCVVFDDWVGDQKVLVGDMILGSVVESMVAPAERKLAKELGVYLVDMFNVTKNNKLNGIKQSSDGLHPNLAYDRLAAEFAVAVKKVCGE